VIIAVFCSDAEFQPTPTRTVLRQGHLMAIVRRLVRNKFGIQSRHTETHATYLFTSDAKSGERFLQIDTYGSAKRKILGKKSQSMRFSKRAARELRRILDRF
jgi:hypothetical protein